LVSFVVAFQSFHKVEMLGGDFYVSDIGNFMEKGADKFFCMVLVGVCTIVRRKWCTVVSCSEDSY